MKGCFVETVPGFWYSKEWLSWICECLKNGNQRQGRRRKGPIEEENKVYKIDKKKGVTVSVMVSTRSHKNKELYRQQIYPNLDTDKNKDMDGWYI